ncbi:hypothetical protein TIFTF001_011088 [Ficus carica]|uniref:Uncharacterized protein n=1 Tax=Ficus carica TaxID=3494 RepID=A0AA88D2K0_FICCA|nr:hypothetical protein TIFTF001_011088 [Ficus carica]
MDFGLPPIMARGLNFCNRKNPYDQSKIPDLVSSMEKGWPILAYPKNNGTKFWAHEWNKHGTCSESVLDQHAYFQASLNLKKKVNLLQNLKNVGINPDGKLYTMASITKAITDALGFAPAVIRCNTDPSGHSQLHKIYICLDSSGSNLITCPLFLKSGCRSEIEFHPF